MESKYYLPTIDEFHVGFEYEKNSNGYDDKWHNEIIFAKFDDGVWRSNIDDVISTIEDGCDNYRVKYLDSSDIESLGFRFWKTHPGTTTHEFETSDGRYNITFDPNWGSGWNCSIQDEVDFTFFHGYVKNKSELKVILKQVGIINE